MSTILIVEDEVKIAQVIHEYLDSAGYATQIFNEGTGVIEWLRANEAALVLLDVMLPGKDGLEICKEIRAFSTVPIIMVTARVEEVDRLLGLELGADDYVCKPFSPRELVARVKANLRRASFSESDQPGTVSNDKDFEIDEFRHVARLDNQPLELTKVEYRILLALLELPGRVLSRDQLMDRMYDDQRVVGDRAVDSHIANLRRKLQAVRPDSECIHSVYGVGYKLEI